MHRSEISLRFATLLSNDHFSGGLLPPALLALGLLLACPARAESLHLNPSLAELADESTCLAVYSSRDELWLVNNLQQCQRPLSPCSTFKIPNALLALETGVLDGPAHRMGWDGQMHDRQVLNQDHDLQSAMSNSVVWYFQEVARQIGTERMQAALDSIDYGNRDISAGIDTFWLGSSLKISALQQVDFIRQLANGKLPFSTESQQTTLALLEQTTALPTDFRGTLYGKTGSCPMPGDDHGWFVGAHLRDDNRLYFAVNVIGEKRWGPDARRIAIEMLQAIK